MRKYVILLVSLFSLFLVVRHFMLVHANKHDHAFIFSRSRWSCGPGRQEANSYGLLLFAVTERKRRVKCDVIWIEKRGNTCHYTLTMKISTGNEMGKKNCTKLLLCLLFKYGDIEPT